LKCCGAGFVHLVKIPLILFPEIAIFRLCFYFLVLACCLRIVKPVLFCQLQLKNQVKKPSKTAKTFAVFYRYSSFCAFLWPINPCLSVLPIAELIGI
jgi:hypothetical protein